MTIQPSSTITLYAGIPFDPGYTHTLYFSSLAEQKAFFSGWGNKISFDDYYYIRDNRALKIQPNANTRSMWSYNYLHFSNPDGSSFYGFIQDVDYINNNTYLVKFTIDFIQTFLPLCTINPCLVDREHVANDNKGAHTEPEPFEGFGQLIYSCIASPASNIADVPTYADSIKQIVSGTEIPLSNLMFSDVSMSAVIMCSQDITKLEGWDFTWQARNTITPAEMAGNVYNGGAWFYSYWVNSQTDLEKIAGVLNFLQTKGQMDSVINIFMCPDGIFETSKRADGGLQHGLDVRIDVDTSKLGVYTPKNNKLFTYPFSYLYVTNSEGNAAVYKYEYFDAYEQNYGRTFFAFTGQLAPGTVLGIFPRNYAGNLYATDQMLTTSPYPLCAWASDVYSAYVALNSGKISTQQEAIQFRKNVAVARNATGAITNTIGGVMSAIAGNAGGAVNAAAGLTNNVVDAIVASKQADLEAKAMASEMYDISVIPPQAHGNSSGDPIMSAGTKGFTFFNVFPNSESCRIIDDYFTQYGYHRGVVKIPELTSRRNWNYVKTCGSRILGSVPASAIAILNGIFDRGITLWHNISTYGDYSQENSIVTGG